jgi:hypothetical protein
MFGYYRAMAYYIVLVSTTVCIMHGVVKQVRIAAATLPAVRERDL